MEVLDWTLYSRSWSINEHCLSVLAFIADLSPITLGDGSTWPDLNRLFFTFFPLHALQAWDH